MQFVIKGKNIQLTPALKEYAEKKLMSIKKYFDDIVEIDVTLSVKDSKDLSRSKVCEVTAWAGGHVIRGRKTSEDLYASIDMVTDKIERQVKKFKEKQTNRKRHPKGIDKSLTHSILAFGEGFTEQVGAEEETDDMKHKIVRSGTFPMRPMHSDEAAEQLELMKQDFFVFSNADTDKVNVIYRRSDGYFGLIEPEY